MSALLAMPDWGDLFSLTVPLTEIIARGSIMYCFLFMLFRFVIRRDVGAVGIADLLVLVIVADAAQNGMAGDSTSLADGMALVATLIGWNVLLDWLAFRFAFVRRFAEPKPIKLAERGRLLPRNMRREFISEDELWSKLRQSGVESLDQVKVVYMEADGQISVIKA
ncbi:MAG TPA: YetF domain-containing protein [Noviherbaspirillum sp.]|nr:YetF domain-containing protein [Noviherbaspirillum sp.]